MLVLTEPFLFQRTSPTYRDLDWVCKSLLALRMYTQMSSINWMFVEGLFLHTRLTCKVFPSRAPFTTYYIIGWGVPLVLLLCWSVTMAIQHPVHCWSGYPDLPYIWILVAPMITALLMNLIFLINIIRILVTKLSTNSSSNNNNNNKSSIANNKPYTSTTNGKNKHRLSIKFRRHNKQQQQQQQQQNTYPLLQIHDNDAPLQRPLPTIQQQQQQRQH
ncbi:hypothetical protein Pcinc_041403 [Petrolisthes cinctipes]|uniref:G-protein coupled receptors family 2 profile 2 domain-containing protein n=1 Tax=Petrolisthes cinctipes TaxID=88211 RepID=A0AAE1BK90_PETCI|nr:hypothetical protein Pcinc_041403 [Petrolisthes cinctipes]